MRLRLLRLAPDYQPLEWAEPGQDIWDRLTELLGYSSITHSVTCELPIRIIAFGVEWILLREGWEVWNAYPDDIPGTADYVPATQEPLEIPEHLVRSLVRVLYAHHGCFEDGVDCQAYWSYQPRLFCVWHIYFRGQSANVAADEVERIRLLQSQLEDLDSGCAR